jgi:molybdopterin-guanine dinucleotide biosynthesis protein A
MWMPESSRIVAIILAGGQARRMGGRDKSLLHLGDLSLLQHVVNRIEPQVDAILLNANGDATRFSEYGLPVQADLVGGYAGPLAGVLTGMAWVRQQLPQCPWLVTVAADTPFFPLDYVERLWTAVMEQGTQLACAQYGERTQPVFGLWPVALYDSLHTALVDEGLRRVDQFTARYPISHVSFSDLGYNPFFNINCMADLQVGVELWRQLSQQQALNVQGGP